MWSFATGKKRNRKSGFTLAETLLTVLLMSVVLGAVASGIGVTKKAHDAITKKSRAGQMLSLASVRMEKDLGTAGDFVTEEDGTVCSFVSVRRSAAMTYQEGKRGVESVMLSEDGKTKTWPLLSEKECPGGLKVCFKDFRLSKDGRSVSITLMVKDQTDTVVEKQTYVWRAVNSYKESEEEK